MQIECAGLNGLVALRTAHREELEESEDIEEVEDAVVVEIDEAFGLGAGIWIGDFTDGEAESAITTELGE